MRAFGRLTSVATLCSVAGAMAAVAACNALTGLGDLVVAGGGRTDAAGSRTDGATNATLDGSVAGVDAVLVADPLPYVGEEESTVDADAVYYAAQGKDADGGNVYTITRLAFAPGSEPQTITLPDGAFADSVVRFGPHVYVVGSELTRVAVGAFAGGSASAAETLIPDMWRQAVAVSGDTFFVLDRVSNRYDLRTIAQTGVLGPIVGRLQSSYLASYMFAVDGHGGAYVSDSPDDTSTNFRLYHADDASIVDTGCALPTSNTTILLGLVAGDYYVYVTPAGDLARIPLDGSCTPEPIGAAPASFSKSQPPIVIDGRVYLTQSTSGKTELLRWQPALGSGPEHVAWLPSGVRNLTVVDGKSLMFLAPSPTSDDSRILSAWRYDAAVQ